MLYKLVCLCIVFLYVFQLSDCTEHVLELDDKFLDMEKENMWLVMFYAPWCGHCRVMEPTWVEIGATFNAENSDVKVGRVDATKYSSIASHYAVRGFPTIKFFKDGFQFDYKGARNKHSIVAFVNRAKGSSITPISNSEEFLSTKQKNDVFFVYIGNEDESLHKMFLPITKQLFTSISFYSASKGALPKDISIKKEPTLLVFKDKSYYELPDDLPDAEFLKMWVETEQFQAYNELTGFSYHLLRASGRRFAIVVLNEKDKFNETFNKMALERKHPYMFCWVLGNSIANSMTKSNISIPNVLVFDTQSYDHFVMNDDDDESRELSKDNVEDFFQKINDGSLKAKGGNGFVANIERMIVESIKDFVDLFTRRPLVASLIVIVPSLLLATMCVCLCSMRDEDVRYRESRPPVDLADEVEPPTLNSGDAKKEVKFDEEDVQEPAETSEPSGEVRKRIKGKPSKE